jgi:hypothetical protein
VQIKDNEVGFHAYSKAIRSRKHKRNIYMSIVKRRSSGTHSATLTFDLEGTDHVVQRLIDNKTLFHEDSEDEEAEAPPEVTVTGHQRGNKRPDSSKVSTQ